MERLKRMSFKKALLTIALINLSIALALSGLAVWGCQELRVWIIETGVSAALDPSAAATASETGAMDQALQTASIISYLQIILPALIFVAALLTTALLFYHLKLKEPLRLLSDESSDVPVETLALVDKAASGVKLGQLFAALESVQQSHAPHAQEPTQRGEESKQSDTAVPPDLITKLKNYMDPDEQDIIMIQDCAGSIADSLNKLRDSTAKLGQYVEVMGKLQRLKETQPNKESVDFQTLARELMSAIRLVATRAGIESAFMCMRSSSELRLDKEMLYQIAEILVSNALRFASHSIAVGLSLSRDELTLVVADDGCGFPRELLDNGIRPLQNDVEEDGHLGMDLFACDMLCQKHGGHLIFDNTESGAIASAVLNIK